jgi:dihydrodipicolinate reductase
MPGGQYINHFGAIRLRVTGSGTMEVKLVSMDTTTESILADVTLQTTTPRYVNQLANFNQQKAQLVLGTTELNDYFLLRQIIFYVKPIAESFPQ